MKRIGFILVQLATLVTANAQMVMNGGQVAVQNGAHVVLTGGNPSALTILNTNGGFVINDATSRLRWYIYSNYGSYTVPFYYSGTYLPLSFSTSLAQGGGYLDLGTYATPIWKNSDYLPPGVTNVNHNGTDNSAHVIDRFWSINAGDYVTKPTLSNLSFTYRDVEWNAAGNSISEPLLKAQRWNNTLSHWSDFAPAGTVNTGSNTVTLAIVSPADLYQWWTLVDAAYPLPLQLLSFKARLMDRKVLLDWNTNLEINTKEFVVERSSDRIRFYPIDTIAAAGNSNTMIDYSTIDPAPLTGISYYRLKMIDIDEKFTYSSIAVITNEAGGILVYPNPVKDRININLGNTKVHSYAIFDSKGSLVIKGVVTNTLFSVDVSELSQGGYLLQLYTASGTRIFALIKD